MSGGWFVDRTRYMRGFECPWARMLGYHAFGTGLTPASEAPALAVGKAVHAGLEALLKPYVEGAGATVTPRLVTMTQAHVENATQKQVAEFKLWLAEEYVRNNLDQSAVNFHIDTVESLIHLYAALVIPYLVREKHRIVSVEQELLLRLGETLHWMARPDLITQKDNQLFVHDFKTSVYSMNPEEWQDSLQMMLNCFAAEKTWKRPVAGYYIHALKKGSKDRPLPLTNPWYQPANPPFQAEAWALQAKDGAKMPRVRIRDQKSLPAFVWEVVNKANSDQKVKEIIFDYAKLLGPFPVSNYKVNQFMSGLGGNESWWMQKLDGVDWSRWADEAFQAELDMKVPRTFDCRKWNRPCDYYALCFKQDGWQKVFTNFSHREPHHTTEPHGLPVWPKGQEPKQ